jgi:O-acetyl-ADP-ribose deacetylase (regulator of RNase III)
MFAEYKRVCRLGLASGGLFEWRSPGGSWIYNLATQPRPGRCASLPAITEALRHMTDHARDNGVRRIGLPRIGCGYGGLDYRDVRPVLLAAADDLDLVVVEKKR